MSSELYKISQTYKMAESEVILELKSLWQEVKALRNLLAEVEVVGSLQRWSGGPDGREQGITRKA